MTHDIHDRTIIKNLSLILPHTFVDSNQNVVLLHRQNMAPTCGSKIFHVWPQKKQTNKQLLNVN